MQLPSPKSHMYWPPPTSLRQFLRAIWEPVSWAIVFIRPQINRNSRLSRCTFFRLTIHMNNIAAASTLSLQHHFLPTKISTQWVAHHSSPSEFASTELSSLTCHRPPVMPDSSPFLTIHSLLCLCSFALCHDIPAHVPWSKSYSAFFQGLTQCCLYHEAFQTPIVIQHIHNEHLPCGRHDADIVNKDG